MRLVVCPAASFAAVHRERNPSHVLTLSSPGRPLPDLPQGAEHLALAFNDIAEERPGLIAPDAEAVAAIVALGRGWDGARPLLVSCEFGISRSTAAAFVVACDRSPAVPEQSLALVLRQAAPCATPNPLVVALADRLLGREGRMIAAIAAIGRGAEYRPYVSFEFALPLA